MYSRPWTPIGLRGYMAFWWDASDPGTIEIATGAKNWFDKSPNSLHLTQGTAASQPALTRQGRNGLNVLTFDGSNDYMTVSGTVNVPSSLDFYVFAAWAPNAISAYHNLFDSSAARPMLWVNSSNSIELNAGDVFGAVADGNWRTLQALNFSASQEVWQNGALDSSLGSTTVTSGAKTMTFFNRGAASTYSGKMGEMIGFNKALPLDLRYRVDGYLAWKWGLQANLPATHPYKNRRP